MPNSSIIFGLNLNDIFVEKWSNIQSFLHHTSTPGDTKLCTPTHQGAFQQYQEWVKKISRSQHDKQNKQVTFLHRLDFLSQNFVLW